LRDQSSVSFGSWANAKKGKINEIKITLKSFIV